MAKTAVKDTIGLGFCITCRTIRQGKVVSYSDDVKAGSDKKGVARLGDRVKCNTCGSIGFMILCSSTVKVNGRNRARIGDEFAGIFSGVLILDPVDTIDVGG